jgi:hypothetical protein
MTRHWASVLLERERRRAMALPSATHLPDNVFMATKKPKARKPAKKPVKPAVKRKKKKPPKPNPFDGSATLQLIKQPPQPVIHVDQNNGEVRKLVVDKSGLTSYWEKIGEQGPIGHLPPEVGGIPDDLADLIVSGDPADVDALVARSAASFSASGAQYNANLYARATTAYNDWRRTGKRGEPKMPGPATFDPSEWERGVNHYRPANFQAVYHWMIDHDSGRNPDSAKAAIPIPPEYDY